MRKLIRTAIPAIRAIPAVGEYLQNCIGRPPAVLADHGVLPEFIEVEFERVLAAVYAPFGAGR
jgi:hypothetical protein